MTACLRVGSSNLNNRSMGFDTECDLAVEAVPGSPGEQQLRATILSIRQDLLCEHLDVRPDAFQAAMQSASGSLLKAVEALRGRRRTLRAFEQAAVAEDESALAENELLDPERTPASLKERITGRVAGILNGVGIRR